MFTDEYVFSRFPTRVSALKIGIIFLFALPILSTKASGCNERDTAVLGVKNIAGIVILGDGARFSFNYERLFIIDSNLIISGKVGFGVTQDMSICLFGSCTTPTQYNVLSHQVTANMGRERHFFETGVGGSLITNDGLNEKYLIYPMLGLRWMPIRRNPSSIRIFVQIPIKLYARTDLIFIPVGISMGIGF